MYAVPRDVKDPVFSSILNSGETQRKGLLVDCYHHFFVSEPIRWALWSAKYLPGGEITFHLLCF